MAHKIMLVVGDRFETFRSRKENVLLYSEYLEILSDHPKWEIASSFYVPSQGLSSEEVAVVLENVSQANRDFLDKVGAVPSDISTATHKHKKSNIVITTPIRLTDSRYAAKLHIDDNCAEMSDHVTKCHLQGILLIEAARQLFIAVTETYFLAPEERGSKYFVINTFDVKFKAFAFPVATDMFYEVKSMDINARSERFEADIDIIQAGTSVCSVAVNFTVFESVPLTNKEVQKSTIAVEKEVERLFMAFTEGHGA